MGFLSPLKKIGGALGKLPGAKTLTKPINKLAGKTPGLKGMPAAFGMGAKPKSPIAPSPGVVQGGISKSPKPVGVGADPTIGAPMAQPPPMQMEAPEAVPGMMEQQAPPMMQPQPMDQTSLSGPIAQQPNPQMGGQMMPQMGGNLAQMLQQRNTGITGGMKNRRPMGPSFMG